MEKCENCLFARSIPKPQIKTIDADSLMGNIYKHLADEEFDKQTQESQTKIICHRYPATVKKDKSSFCGEYKESKW